MAEALVEAFAALDEQQQPAQQQGDAAGSSAAAAAAAGRGGGGELPLLPKEAFVLHLVRECCGTAAEPKPERVVVFTQSMSVLTALGHLLTEKLGYVRDVHFLRLDGSATAASRAGMIRQFNSSSSKAKVFLISTRAGSVGINLVSARRLVLYDLLWNPVHNKQAVSRVWRYGQTKPCYIYHLIYAGTFETRVAERVLLKEELFQRVVERQAKRAKLADKDVDLYCVESHDPLAPAPLARQVKSLFATGASQADERVLTGLAQQADLVRQLQLISLDNHADQLLEDPTANLSMEDRLKATLDAEMDTRAEEEASGPLASARKGVRTKRVKNILRALNVTREDFEAHLAARRAEREKEAAAERLQAQLLSQQQQQQQAQQQARQPQLNQQGLRQQQLQGGLQPAQQPAWEPRVQALMQQQQQIQQRVQARNELLFNQGMQHPQRPALIAPAQPQQPQPQQPQQQQQQQARLRSMMMPQQPQHAAAALNPPGQLRSLGSLPNNLLAPAPGAMVPPATHLMPQQSLPTPQQQQQQQQQRAASAGQMMGQQLSQQLRQLQQQQSGGVGGAPGQQQGNSSTNLIEQVWQQLHGRQQQQQPAAAAGAGAVGAQPQPAAAAIAARPAAIGAAGAAAGLLGGKRTFSNMAAAASSGGGGSTHSAGAGGGSRGGQAQQPQPQQRSATPRTRVPLAGRVPGYASPAGLMINPAAAGGAAVAGGGLAASLAAVAAAVAAARQHAGHAAPQEFESVDLTGDDAVEG